MLSNVRVDGRRTFEGIKHELQNIIFRDEQAGTTSQLKKVQRFLIRYAEIGINSEKQQQIESEETAL